MSKGEIKPDNFSGYFEEEVYSKGLSREDTIESHIRRAIYFYSKGLWDEFEYSVKILITILPSALKEQMKELDHNTSSKGVQEHYNQFKEIQRCLEDETNMIFKKKFIKTYE
jgi:hypothetical protein